MSQRTLRRRSALEFLLAFDAAVEPAGHQVERVVRLR